MSEEVYFWAIEDIIICYWEIGHTYRNGSNSSSTDCTGHEFIMDA